MDDSIEIPEYFLCPISLQIMKDPVTAVSGITYDRDNIEQWLYKAHNTICPVSKQALPPDSDLTPNHTLRRLIQAWCTANQGHGIDRIPTPKPPISKFYVINLMRDLSRPKLQKLEALAAESDRNRVYMVQAGLGKALVDFIVTCYRNREADNGLEEAVSLVCMIRGPLRQSRTDEALTESVEIFDALTWRLGFDDQNNVFKSNVASSLKIIVQRNPSLLETLKPEFIAVIMLNLRRGRISHKGMDALLYVLLEACPWGRNRVLMVELGMVFDLIELELQSSENKTTELVLGILYHLCLLAEGRAQFLSHAAAIAVVTRHILKVSPTADDRVILILWLISKYSGTNGLIQEMLRVGTAAKLCTVMQVDCGAHLKEKAREILRKYSDAWKDSPCVEVATLTRYTRWLM